MRHKLEVGDVVKTEEYNFTRIELVTHRGQEGVLMVNIGPKAFAERSFKERYVRDCDSWGYSSNIVRKPSEQVLAQILREAYKL